MVAAMGMHSTYYWCRLHPKKQRASRSTGERKRGLRKVDSCPMKLTMVTQHHWTAEAGWIPVSVSYRRQGNAEEHNHEMEQVDILKRNNSLRDLVGGEVANGYQPHQIFRNLQGHHRRPEAQQMLVAAGGEYIRSQRRFGTSQGLIQILVSSRWRSLSMGGATT